MPAFRPKPPPSAPAAERLTRVLAVVTEGELLDFLPEPLLAEARTVADEFIVVDSTGLDAGGLVAALERHRPAALVACWSTPPLPAQPPAELRYVCHLAGSVKPLVTRAHLESGLLVTNWGASISRTVAEAALLHILGALRRASHWAVAMHTRGAWKDDTAHAASLFGRTVGIHGFGPVARELVRLLRPFGVVVHVFAPDVTAEVARRNEVQRSASLESLFSESDVLVELAPLIPETVGLVREEHLRLLRPGSVFVNVGRGAVVDEAALVRVAREGQVQFGLDVFAHEPLPADHPLRGMSNVMLTPHMAGPTHDRRRDAGALAVRNLRAFAAGRPLDAFVTPEIYDAST